MAACSDENRGHRANPGLTRILLAYRIRVTDSTWMAVIVVG